MARYTDHTKEETAPEVVAPSDAEATAAYDAQPRVRLQKAIDDLRAHRGDLPDRLAALEAFAHQLAVHIMTQLPEAVAKKGD